MLLFVNYVVLLVLNLNVEQILDIMMTHVLQRVMMIYLYQQVIIMFYALQHII